MTARLSGGNAKSKHWRGLQPDALERTANPTAADPPGARLVDQSTRLVLRVLAVALVAFWCAVTLVLLAWREL